MSSKKIFSSFGAELLKEIIELNKNLELVAENIQRGQNNE